MNAINRSNASNTSSISLRRRPPFLRQNSPHSVVALNIDIDDDIKKPTTPAMRITIESSNSTVTMEDSLSSIVSNHLMTPRDDNNKASTKSPEDAATDDLEQNFDAEPSTTSEFDQDQSQGKAELLITACPLKNCLKKKSPGNKPKRSIHFHETVAIGSIPTLDEYSHAELLSMYYSHKEEQVLRSQTKSIVRVLRAASSLPHPDQPHIDDNIYCARGLENYLLPTEEKRARRVMSKEHIYSVIEAQHVMTMEQEEGSDDNALAMISLRSSHQFREVAIDRAAGDEAEVKLMLLQQTKAHMTAQAEAQQQRVAAVRRASMTNGAAGSSSSSRSYMHAPSGARNNSISRAACA